MSLHVYLFHATPSPIIDVVHIKNVNSVISETDGDILEETEQLSDDECDNHLSNIPDSVPDLTSSLSEDEDSPDFSDDLSYLSTFSSIDLKEHQSKTLANNRSYFKIKLNNGTTKLIKKSAVCWFFYEKSGRLSSDRIYRVQGMSSKIKKTNAKIVDTSQIDVDSLVL